MKKQAFGLLLLVLLAQSVLAANLNVEFLESNNVILVEEGNNATFTLSIFNNQSQSDSFQIYSLVSASIYPKEPFSISANAQKTLEIIVVPHEETVREERGNHVFEYQIKGQQTGFFTDRMTIRILEVKDAVEIEVSNVGLEDDEVTISVENKENVAINNLNLVLKSDFFEVEETISLQAEERKEFTAPLKVEEIKDLSAGEHSGTARFELNGIKSEREFTLNYLEQGELSVSEEEEGFIVQKDTIVKKNEGNIVTTATVNAKKDVFSRLFTTFSEEPKSAERNGLVVDYTWERDLLPNEELRVIIRTNYTAPFAVIIALILIFLLVKFVLHKSLSLEKRVSFVKTRGGEFALKVKLRVKAHKTVESIKIIDRIPHGLKLYEKFGSTPHEKEEATRRIGWHINRLNAGEERIFTYIIYSKINIFGRFELPIATATYKEGNDLKSVQSNATSFAAETSSRED